MSSQKFGDHRSMFSKQILPNIYLGTYKGIAKKGAGVFNRKTQKNRGTQTLIDLTLKVENASEATSKVGNSTNLKNNSKLGASNTYLKNHYKI